jgi:hypothetical protein
MTFKRHSNAIQTLIQTPFRRATDAHLFLRTPFILPSHTNPLTPLRVCAPLGSQHTREEQPARAARPSSGAVASGQAFDRWIFVRSRRIGVYRRCKATPSKSRQGAGAETAW